MYKDSDTKGKIKRVVLMPSIMGTGTRVVLDDIFKENRLFHSTNFWKDAACENIVVYGHVRFKEHLTMWKNLLDKDYYVVVPLRHPARVLESNLRKGLYTDRFNYQWNIFIDEIDKYKPTYIHVDKDIRYKEVEKISKDLDIELGNEWNIKHTDSKTYNLLEEDLITKHYGSINTKFTDFYNRTIEDFNNVG
jgi:hypothetical protein